MLPGTVDLHELVDIVNTILDARDPYTLEHSLRVAEYAEKIAADMRLDPCARQRVHIAAHFHDIGKIGVPDAVLNKPGRLTEEDRRAIQTHPRFGYNILRRLPALAVISEIVLYHHERFDGLGYPDGLRGERIPLESRIIAVADAFDAMTSDRPYRCGMSAEAAAGEIRRHAGGQFCPLVVRHFNRVVHRFDVSAQGVFPSCHFAFAGHEDLMHSKMAGRKISGQDRPEPALSGGTM
ncbi:HD-GYP domain-containing protein [Desulfonema ishimotonii]|uniref:HD-GYP domain-containing protein n=1 Tax=Desulfonema ishimotonii TaxID=45657 RepID=A0A401G2V9_9BACT|nr:HD-GYP domain-containing protein [Desulfonema ishimotonii]GBC63511.1 HD-GYP domain-containing protein [Desulfonema ishimotonii]